MAKCIKICSFVVAFNLGLLVSLTSEATRKVSKRNFERGACPIKCRLDPNTQACVQAQALSRNETTVESICTRFLQQRFESSSDCAEKCDNCEPMRMISQCTKTALGKRFSICKLKPDIGPCRARFTMWYYDAKDGACKVFLLWWVWRKRQQVQLRVGVSASMWTP